MRHKKKVSLRQERGYHSHNQYRDVAGPLVPWSEYLCPCGLLACWHVGQTGIGVTAVTKKFLYCTVNVGVHITTVSTSILFSHLLVYQWVIHYSYEETNRNVTSALSSKLRAKLYLSSSSYSKCSFSRYWVWKANASVCCMGLCNTFKVTGVFLDVFAKLQKVIVSFVTSICHSACLPACLSVCLPACLPGTVLLLMDWFWWNLIFVTFSKICWGN